MVKHQDHGKNYWTLPGGGVIESESLEQATIREVLEETHLDINVVKLLFEEPYEYGISYCFLATVKDSVEAELGHDPEEKDVPPQHRMLQEVGWHSLETMKHDQQVSKVMATLTL